MELEVTNSPFNQEQIDLLNRLLPTLNNTQKIWLSGYLTAQLLQTKTESVHADAKVSTVQKIEEIPKEIQILYGSQTGNAQKLAESFTNTLKNEGFVVNLSSMSDFKTNNLKKLHNLLIVVSTYGEGTPPDNALSFYEFLHGKRAPKLEGLNFSVLALGDRSYELFCQTGKDFDKRLDELGAKRLYPRVDCDLDFEDDAQKWLQGVIAALNSSKQSAAKTAVPQIGLASESQYSRKNPFYAEVLENINLNGRGSNKETRHIELSLEGSGLTYEPGDCLGIYPKNDPALVAELINELKLNKDEQVTVDSQQVTLEEALISHYEITLLTKKLMTSLKEYTNNQKLEELFADEAKLKEYLKGRDVLDFVRDFGPVNLSAEQLVSLLRKMPPRLYSISSSFKANPDEVHVTVGVVRYEAHGRERKGVCSTYCAERLAVGDTVAVFVQSNSHFKLPENPEAPIIMIGPGTGIAPFRSFVQERQEIGATGKSWLFFGDQHFVTDFLYQTEWQKWIKEGVLTKMDVAFSRDSEEKVYVQHKLKEHSQEIFQWIQEGAYIYVCGDKQKMAQDVHETLIAIIAESGNMDQKEAENYLSDLQKQKRYQRDVY